MGDSRIERGHRDDPYRDPGYSDLRDSRSRSEYRSSRRDYDKYDRDERDRDYYRERSRYDRRDDRDRDYERYRERERERERERDRERERERERDRDRYAYRSRDHRDSPDYRSSERERDRRYYERSSRYDERYEEKKAPIIIVNDGKIEEPRPLSPSSVITSSGGIISDYRKSSSSHSHSRHESSRSRGYSEDTSRDYSPRPRARSASLAPNELIESVPPPHVHINKEVPVPPDPIRTIIVTTHGFLLEIYLKRMLELSGTIKRSSHLSYTALFYEFLTHTQAMHATAHMQRESMTNKRIRHYVTKLAPDAYINKLIIARSTDANTILDPPRCLVLHGFTAHKEADNFFKPFEAGMQRWERIGDDYYTYHTNMASFKDFYSAFNEGNAGLPNSYVTETFNTAKLKEDVYEIIRQKLIKECMQDVNQMLVQDLYVHVLRRVQYYNEVILPNKSKGLMKPQSTGKLINFYMSSNPIVFRLSGSSLPTINILKRVKKASKEKKTMMLKKDTENYQKTIMDQMYEISDPIEGIRQPELNGPCARLSPIRPIKEKRKREYLRPYARARLQPVTVARDSGLKIRQSQFPTEPKPMLQRRGLTGMAGMRRGFGGKRVYFEKSTIQGYGLFALEPISTDSFICEYNGELIRSRIADLREKQYEAAGFPHMFLFRIDNDSVVDATMRGGKSRFLNHSCHPNCRANVVNVGKTQTISFYAIRNIKPHDEITFNYQMEFEDRDKREKCYCGAKQCLGYLNYCDDPEVRRQREYQAYLEYLEAQEGY